jgi:hypothetical protein
MLCYERKSRAEHNRYGYDTPWQERDSLKTFCSEECADIYMYQDDFSYFYCDPCEREICEQNPANGWHIQYRWVDDGQICLRCYQDRILDEGMGFERQKLERGEIPGMFFSYGNLEPMEAGYEEVPGFTDYRVDSEERADAFRKKALELLDQGRKVVIGYERFAYGGGEGYVTLMAKGDAEAEKPP